MADEDSSNRSRKRSRSSSPAAGSLKTDDDLCCFCQKELASIYVEMPTLKPAPPPSSKAKPSSILQTRPAQFCMLHYYTTSAVRVGVADPSRVSILNQHLADTQLSSVVQPLFAECFIQLQRDLSETSAQSFSTHRHDPLAMLNHFHSSKSMKHRKKKAPPKPTLIHQQKREQREHNSQGGFLRSVPLPERLLKTQQQQARIQTEYTARMTRASQPKDLSQRRKPARKSVWNAVLDENEKGQVLTKSHTATNSSPYAKSTTSKVPSFLVQNESNIEPGKSCCCGGKEVESLSTNTSRNQNMGKGETWGNKDRGDEVVIRYRCLKCGKVWNEEE